MSFIFFHIFSEDVHLISQTFLIFVTSASQEIIIMTSHARDRSFHSKIDRGSVMSCLGGMRRSNYWYLPASRMGEW